MSCGKFAPIYNLGVNWKKARLIRYCDQKSKKQGNNENKYGQKSLAKMYLSANAYRTVDSLWSNTMWFFFTKIVNLHSINVFGWVLALLFQCVRRHVHMFYLLNRQTSKSSQNKPSQFIS